MTAPVKWNGHPHYPPLTTRTHQTLALETREQKPAEPQNT